jgi:hypothetical protein
MAGTEADRERGGTSGWTTRRAGAIAVVLLVVTATVVRQARRPHLRIVNVSERPLSVSVDDRMVAALAPVSWETPEQGETVRVAAGAHELVARGADGVVVDRTTAELVAGHEHLWAPAHGPRCFRIEVDAYGAAREGAPRDVELPATASAWDLGSRVDAWFEPNPPSRASDRWSGGVRRAVRERACDAPSR